MIGDEVEIGLRRHEKLLLLDARQDEDDGRAIFFQPHEPFAANLQRRRSIRRRT